MKKDQYFKHDASASSNRKLMKLCREEGLRGYGAYWVLIESLRNQPRQRDSLELLNVLAYRVRTKPAFLLHIVTDYELFVVEQGEFYSPGLCKRLKNFINRQQADEKLDQARQDLHNTLINNVKLGDNAGTAEQSREEKKLPQEKVQILTPKPEQPADRQQARSDGLREIISFDAAMDALRQQEAWREEMAMKSGHSQLFVHHFEELMAEFARFLRLRGEEGTVMNVNDAKRRFYYWMIASQGRECLETLKSKQQNHPTDAFRYETLIDLRRTYLGRLIPDEAPPRPDPYSVWDETAKRWRR